MGGSTTSAHPPRRVEARLERTYSTAREAEELRLALEADRPEHLATERSGPTLTFTVRAASATSVRATLDDLLAALAVAERTRGIGSSAVRAVAGRTQEDRAGPVH
ncbi:MAG: hypothetical protein L3K04_00800 [Thermoplasmata archaeon]|nr:hypothetical protein [Thermoplasmata archaeon]MCI4340845.1 hypothetical protein [Thermoplasmata archaeon]